MADELSRVLGDSKQLNADINHGAVPTLHRDIAQLEALNKKRVQQRKRTINEATRMAGANFVSSHMDPKIRRRINDLQPLLAKPGQEEPDPTDIAAYLEDTRRKLITKTIFRAQTSSKSYNDDAFERAMESDWDSAQQELLDGLEFHPDGLAGSATELSFTGNHLADQHVVDSLIPIPWSAIDTDATDEYLVAVNNFADKKPSEKANMLREAFLNVRGRTKQAEDLYRDLWTCAKFILESKEHPRKHLGGENPLPAMLDGCLKLLETEYRAHLEQHGAEERGHNPSFNVLARRVMGQGGCASNNVRRKMNGNSLYIERWGDSEDEHGRVSF
jgi:hypothetical protein